MKPETNNPRRPSHLVVSMDDGLTVAQALQGTSMRVTRSAKAASRLMRAEGAEVYAARREGGAETRIYPQLNVAAMDLDETEATRLRSSGLLVVKNERRSILGWRSGGSMRSSDHIPIPGPTAPPWGWYDTNPSSSHIGLPFSIQPPATAGGNAPGYAGVGEYVRGHRDAIEAILRRLEAPSASTSPAFAAGTGDGEVEWHLARLGIHGGYGHLGDAVKVAVLDTGLDLEHPDFAGRVQSANCRSFVPGVDSVADGNSHGTHCCGLVNGPLKPQRTPRYGAAPNAELLVGKVLGDDGSGYDSEIVAGIAWAAQRGARVISLSLGSPRNPGAPSASAYEQIARRLSRAGLDCLLVAAAGNESRRSSGRLAAVGNPAACPSFLAVAAIDRNSAVADFSNAQLDQVGTLELCAPGVDVRSSVPGALAQSAGEPYAAFSGTSMATPLVAGVATLWRQAFPQLSALEIWRELVRNARPAGVRRDFGFGLVQVP